MAAVTTKKAGGDEAVQLTFPTVFEYTAAAERLPMMMYGMTPPARHIPAASLDDVQEAYHEQKMIDAHRMVMAKVQSQRSSDNYYVKSHQGYIVPPPVLGQRKFANPSFGAAGIGGDLYSARRTAPVSATGLHGGVLRTKEGQKWGATRLQDRVGQINTIEAEHAAFQSGQALDSLATPTAVEQGLPSREVNLLVEFNTYRQSLTDALISGSLDRFALTDFSRMLSILFRIAPSANREELEDMKSGSETMLTLMDGVAEQTREGYDIGRRGTHGPQIRRFIANVGSLVEKTSKYINGMLGGVDLQYKDRLSLSKNLVRSLGFTRLLNTLEIRAPATTPAARAATAAANAPGNDGDEDDDEGGDHFTREAPTREDTEANRNGRFDRDQRQLFGTRSGAYEGEALAGDMPTSTAENTSRRPISNQMTTAVFSQTPARPHFSDVGTLAGYDDDWATSPASLLRQPAAAAAASLPQAEADEEYAPSASARSASVREAYNTLTNSEKLAAIRLASDAGLGFDASRRALGVSFAPKTFEKARAKKPTYAATEAARRAFPELVPAATASKGGEFVTMSNGESFRRGLPVKIEGNRYIVGTPEFEAAYTKTMKGKGRMTPALHAQQKLGKMSGGVNLRADHPDIVATARNLFGRRIRPEELEGLRQFRLDNGRIINGESVRSLIQALQRLYNDMDSDEEEEMDKAASSARAAPDTAKGAGRRRATKPKGGMKPFRPGAVIVAPGAPKPAAPAAPAAPAPASPPRPAKPSASPPQISGKKRGRGKKVSLALE